MMDSLCRKRKLADSFIPCDITLRSVQLLCFFPPHQNVDALDSEFRGYLFKFDFSHVSCLAFGQYRQYQFTHFPID